MTEKERERDEKSFAFSVAATPFLDWNVKGLRGTNHNSQFLHETKRTEM